MLNNISAVDYLTLASGQVFKAEFLDGVCRVRNSFDQELILKVSEDNNTLLINVSKLDERKDDEFLFTAIEYLLGHNSQIDSVNISNAIKEYSSDLLLQKYFLADGDLLSFSRGEFFQLGGSWYKERDQVLSPERFTETNGRAHPVRVDVQSGKLYSRYVPQIQKTLSFRMIDIEADLDIFHEWHNQPRVANFWEMAQPKEELKAFIEKNLKDSHVFPMIAECDGVPVGYFEIYWTREDRLAPYYESEEWDRGFHFLIGATEFLGFNNTDAMLKSLTHFLFLDERRTRKIMAEPRSDNAKVLRYVETFTAWRKLYEFDFPHKRAALLECSRERMFEGKYL